MKPFLANARSEPRPSHSHSMSTSKASAILAIRTPEARAPRRPLTMAQIAVRVAPIWLARSAVAIPRSSQIKDTRRAKFSPSSIDSSSGLLPSGLIGFAIACRLVT